MGKPDTLSRRPGDKPLKGDDAPQSLLHPHHFLKIHAIEVSPDHDIIEKVTKLQYQEENIKKIIELLKTKPLDYHIKNAIADYLLRGNTLLFRRLIYVPRNQKIKRIIVESRYDVLIIGHPGQAKTLEIVSRDYHWPSMKTFINNYVESCDLCQRTKTKTLRAKGTAYTGETSGNVESYAMLYRYLRSSLPLHQV
jgi:hypothetical protein